jgi:hypothetical protein
MDVPVQPRSIAGVGAGVSLDSTLMQAHELTSAAYEALGLSAQEAEQAAADGGMVLNGALVTVAPLPIGNLTGRERDSAFMITVETPYRMDEIAPEAAVDMLSHGPGLLAAFGAALGCQPDGAIVLHRKLDAHDASAATLAHEMLTTQQLVQLLWGNVDTSKEQ